MAVVEPDNEEFLIMLPQASENANLRICRDLDLLEFSSTATYTMAAGDRRISFPANTFVVTEQINVITPAGSINPDTAERNPLTPTSKEVLDSIYGGPSYRDIPQYYAPFDQNLLLVGPFPDANYTVEVVGTFRPAPLSETNTTTFLATYFSDLYIASTMSYVTAYQRNWGAQSDDPRMALSWEQNYATILQSAKTEEDRKKYQASAWSSESTPASATPTR